MRPSREMGHFKSAILLISNIEQHLEQLVLSQEIAGSTYIAEHASDALYPNVAVAAPISIGISEHHMFSPSAFWPNLAVGLG